MKAVYSRKTLRVGNLKPEESHYSFGPGAYTNAPVLVLEKDKIKRIL